MLLKAFLYFKLTPYIAGSVTPASNAEIPDALATCFKSLFLDFNDTASVEAPCAKLEASIALIIKCHIHLDLLTLLMPAGTNAQCIPVITIKA